MPWVIAGVFVLGGIVGAKIVGDIEETAKSVGGTLILGAAAGAGGFLLMKRLQG